MVKPMNVIAQIKKATRRKVSADEKILIVLEGLRSESSISEVCRRIGENIRGSTQEEYRAAMEDFIKVVGNMDFRRRT